MLGKFFYGKLALHEAFWKFCVLGLVVLGFLARLLRSYLVQHLNYDMNFVHAALRTVTLVNGTTALAFFAAYVTVFLALVVYAGICIGAMWNTYKEYEKSKMLALICLFIVVGLAYFGIRGAMY